MPSIFKKRVVVLSNFRKAAMLRRSFQASKIQQLCSFFEHQKTASRFVLFFIQKIKKKHHFFEKRAGTIVKSAQTFVKSLHSFGRRAGQFVKSVSKLVKSAGTFVKWLNTFVKSVGTFVISLRRNTIRLSEK